jgi:hypothetical protein
MKTFNIIIAALVIVIVSAVSFYIGRDYEYRHFGNIDYQAACILNDCCRNMIDNIGLEAEEIYYDYIDNLDCDSELIVTKEDIKHYHWNY